MNIMIDGVEYIPAATKRDGLECCVIRTENAGVFYGYVSEIAGDQITLLDSRRIWRWSGANCLSQLAQEGVKNPGECKFSVREPRKIVRGWIEISPVTPAAKKILDEVPVWRA